MGSHSNHKINLCTKAAAYILNPIISHVHNLIFFSCNYCKGTSTRTHLKCVAICIPCIQYTLYVQLLSVINESSAILFTLSMKHVNISLSIVSSALNPDVQADVGTEAVTMGETQNRRSWEDGWAIWSVFWDQTTDTNSKEWYWVVISFALDSYTFNLLTNECSGFIWSQ